MNRFARSLALIALASLVLAFSTVPADTRAQSVRSPESAPASGACCLPSQVSKWESLLPVRPLNPQAIVGFVTHLRLVNFQVLSRGGNASVHRPNGYNTIQYDFGYIAPSTGNLFVRLRPRFVRVIETVEQRRASGISITKVLRGAQTTPIPAGYYSPLVLVAATPERHLTFFIESNIPRERLRLLGQLVTNGGRAPGSLSPLQALSLCEPKSIEPYFYPHTVAVSGYLRVQLWKPSDSRIYGFIFERGNVPVGAEYNAHWVKYGGLSLGIPARLFHYYLSLPKPHPPVAWHGTLRCSGAFSRLQVDQISMPLPTSGG